jgi:hypothetical protein
MTTPMPSPDQLAAIQQLQAELIAGLAALPRSTPGSLGLGPPPAPQAPQPSSPGLVEEAADHAAHYPVGHFGPESGLTPAQASEANRLLARANRLRPIRGRNARERYARRLGGIKVAVLNQRVGNSAFGRSMLARRGGLTMARHALSHLRAIAHLGGEAAKAARERRKATTHWEQTGEPLPLGPHETDQLPLTQPDALWQQRPFLLW